MMLTQIDRHIQLFTHIYEYLRVCVCVKERKYAHLQPQLQIGAQPLQRSFRTYLSLQCDSMRLQARYKLVISYHCQGPQSQVVPHGKLVFFPSHEQLNDAVSHWRTTGLLERHQLLGLDKFCGIPAAWACPFSFPDFRGSWTTGPPFSPRS